MRPISPSEANQLQQFVASEANRAAAGYQRFIAAQVLKQASVQLGGELGRTVAIFTKAFGTKMARDKGRPKQIHEKAGQLGQQSVVNAVKGRVSRRGRSSNLSGLPGDPAIAGGRYRRYANGAIVKAVSSPGFYRATSSELMFINRPLLDRAAKQWYRLNFGAGVRGQGTARPGQYSLLFFGQRIGKIGLTGGPSPSYRMPPGLWSYQGTSRQTRGKPIPFIRGAHYFVPLGWHGNSRLPTYPSRLSRGFVGYNYLDAGIRRVATTLPAGWTRLMIDWFDEAAQFKTGPISALMDPKEAARGASFLQSEIAALERLVL